MNSKLKLFTVGFTKKTAEHFFEMLAENGVKRIIDVRLKNTSGLSGFSKKNDLKYFLKKIGNIDYTHLTELAPTAEILDAYKKKEITWTEYERKYNELIYTRNIENSVSDEILEGGCLLCSEHDHFHCHRRLITEYLGEKYPRELDVINLK